MSLPILYSLRQCPYAMRARMGLALAGQKVLLRNIVMTNIPDEMFAVSPKGTVPVLLFDDGSVIDESLDIMLWCLGKNDPNRLLFEPGTSSSSDMMTFIKRNDDEFINALYRYKAASRYHDVDEVSCREQCEVFICYLEQCLTKNEFLMGDTPRLVDYVILPFIRQFSRVDRKWYVQAPYPKLQRWLERHYQNPIFSKVMKKYPLWLDTNESVLFGAE